MAVYPNIKLPKKLSLPLYPMTRKLSLDKLCGWTSEPRLVIRGPNWDIIERSNQILISKLATDESYSDNPETCLGFAKSPLNGARFFKVSQDLYLILDAASRIEVFHLVDLRATTIEKVCLWTLESPGTRVETCYASSDLLAWVTLIVEVSFINLYGHEPKGFQICSASIKREAPGIIQTDLAALLDAKEPEFKALCAENGGRATKGRIFTAKNTIAWYGMVEEKDKPVALCFMIMRPMVSKATHIVSGHSTFNLELTEPLPECLFFARPQIHALYLRRDTSGLLFKHVGSRVIQLSKWSTLADMSSVWASSKLQYAWNPRKRSVVVFNERYVDYSTQGDISYFELKV